MSSKVEKVASTAQKCVELDNNKIADEFSTIAKDKIEEKSRAEMLRVRGTTLMSTASFCAATNQSPITSDSQKSKGGSVFRKKCSDLGKARAIEKHENA